MQKSPVQGDAARGLDRPYVDEKARATGELQSTMAGAAKRPPVPRDDTALKNPDGDLEKPAADPKGR